MHAGPLGQAGGQQCGGGVRPHKGGDAPGQIHRRAGAAKAQVRAGEGLPKQPVGHKGRVGQTVRVGAGEQIEHGGVAGDDKGVRHVGGKARRRAQFCQQFVDALPHGPGQFFALALTGSLDAADDVRAPAPLGVHFAGLGQQRAVRAVEAGGQGGGADVHRRARPAEHGRGGGKGLALAQDKGGGVCAGEHFAVAQRPGAAGKAYAAGQLLGRKGAQLLGRGLAQNTPGHHPALAAAPRPAAGGLGSRVGRQAVHQPRAGLGAAGCAVDGDSDHAALTLLF